ncbi:CHAT domain-containing protein [uncultured Lacinutrix sp.]|uniref:CHAT domain-containing protein n=1 Tax=uncultured Lacinutrix sp. TaxID=574032 RepID=UPI002637E0F6|nr:CHAT domain-containing protein [uncultured Lacinutrix sp.]
MAIYINYFKIKKCLRAIIILSILFAQFLNAQNPDYKSNLDFYFDKAYEHFYTNRDSAYFYFNKIKKLAAENNEIETLIEVLISENWSANFHYDLPLIKNNLSQLDSIIKKHKTYLDTIPLKDYYKSSIKYSKAVNNYELKNYNNSLNIFTELTRDIEVIPNFMSNDNIFGLYISAKNFIGKIYNDEGKYDLAKTFHNENLRILNSRPESNQEYKNTTYAMLSDIYTKEKNYLQANNTLLKTLNYHINVTKKSNRIISSYHNIIDNHINLKQIDSSKFYLNKMKSNLTENHPFWYRYYMSESNILKAEKKYNSASNTLDKALQLVKQKWNNQSHNDVAEIYNKIGDLYTEASKPNKAITNYNLAIKQFENDTLNSTINQTTLFKSLKLKASALNKIKKFDSTINTSEKAFAVLDILKPTFKNNNDKLFLIDNAFPVFESGLDALFNLYNNTNDERLIDKAFNYTEKSKSAILLEALLSVKATDYADIPLDIIEKEKLLKSRITHIEKKLNKRKTNALEDELFNIKTQYRNLIVNLESNYKNYYNLKYNSKVISSKTIQEQLKKEELLISYFYGSHSIYVISIGKNNKHFVRIPTGNNIENELISFQKAVSNPKSNVETLSKNSFDIYTKLLQPFLKDTSIKSLIIIPDGLLNYIPFSSLNTKKNNINYLVEDYAVSYLNSATLISQLDQQQNNNNEVIAFAPTFTIDNNNLLPLPNNKKEVATILKHVKGKSFIGTEASLENFNQANNYDIIHLATHAIFNDENPEYSFLAFSSKKDNENLLYTKDLYNLKLNADLVTLSACESGIGDLKRGEGLMSLARGFYFSGAKSIASTLWKINDASSSKLMDHFYLQLSKGENKSRALQKAQVNFITNNKENALSHPYYWSGFVISGNTNPISNSNYWLWLVAGFGFLIGLVFIYFKRK